MYAITGASGNVGSKIAEGLLKAGKKVRIIARDESKLKHLESLGAEIFTCDIKDAEYLTRAFGGAEAVFAMIPSDMQAEDAIDHEHEVGESIEQAIKDAGVKYVVSLSSMGAHTPVNTGIIAGLYFQEQRLNALEDVNVVHLRPGYFMENFLSDIPMIKEIGIMGSPLEADVKIPVTATQDIADAALEYLLDLNFTGKIIREIRGERDLTMDEITSVIGKAIGKEDLKYMQYSYEEAKKFLIENAGASESVADAYIGMSRGTNEGAVNDGERTPESTSKTSIEDFMETYKQAYNS